MLRNALGLSTMALLVPSGEPPETPPPEMPEVLTAEIIHLGNDVYAIDGTYDGEDPVELDYQWKRDGSDMSGQTAETWDNSVSLLSGSITCVITPSDTNGVGDPFETEPYVIGGGGGEATQPTIVSSGKTAVSTSNFLTKDIPYGDALTGDVLIQFAVTGNGQRLHTFPAAGPSGEALETVCLNHRDEQATAGDKVNLSVFLCELTSDVAAGNLTWTIGTSDQWQGGYLLVRGAEAGDVLEAFELYRSNTTDLESTMPSPIPTPVMSVPNAGCLLVNILGTNVDDIDVVPTGWTSQQNGDSGGACVNLATRDAATTASESVPSYDFDYVAAVNHYYAGVIIAINGAV